jgi:hypothetical protein
MAINLNYEQYLRTEVVKGHVTVHNEMSIYQFGTKVLGIQGPQMYSMVKNGALPSELVVVRNVTDKKTGKTERQPFIIVSEAIKFFQARDLEITNKAAKRVEQNPVLVAEAFITMVEADDKKLGKALRKWWTAKNAPAPEAK